MSLNWSIVLMCAAGVLLGGISSIGVVWSDRFARLRVQRKAAQALGATGWRIFWRVVLPGAWVQVSLGILMVLVAAALIRLAMA